MAEAKERERRLESADGRDGGVFGSVAGGFGGLIGNKELKEEEYRLKQIQIQEDVSKSFIITCEGK